MKTAAKRRYERPKLIPSSAFGAEALVGSCCRGGSCTNTKRNAQRTSIDPSKGRNTTAS